MDPWSLRPIGHRKLIIVGVALAAGLTLSGPAQPSSSAGALSPTAVSFAADPAAGLAAGPARLADFVRMFGAAEMLHPGTSLTTLETECRKHFYGGRVWDTFLIPGATAVTPWVIADPGKIKVVSTPVGDQVDVGHICAGLDATAHPSTAGLRGVASVPSNVAAVTWQGDLGSVLAMDFETAHADRRPVTGGIHASHITAFAGPADLLADVDAYVLSGTRAPAGEKLTELLSGYYSGASSVLATARENRFKTFAAAIGLRLFNGVAFGNESSWAKSIAVDLQATAVIYLADRGDLLGALDLRLSDSSSARNLALEFVAALDVQVTKEVAERASSHRV